LFLGQEGILLHLFTSLVHDKSGHKTGDSIGQLIAGNSSMNSHSAKLLAQEPEGHLNSPSAQAIEAGHNKRLETHSPVGHKYLLEGQAVTFLGQLNLQVLSSHND
jgi:hypothetical protein